MKVEESGTCSTNEANPKCTCQPTKQDQNDMEQPNTEAEMPKKPTNWTRVSSWNIGTINISIYISFIRLSIDFYFMGVVV